MHDTCEDFDLCENCEALPIPVHPISHPLLKMKLPTVKIPVVWKPNAVPPFPSFPIPSPIQSPQSPLPPANEPAPFHPSSFVTMGPDSVYPTGPSRAQTPDYGCMRACSPIAPPSPIDPFHWTSRQSIPYCRLPVSPPTPMTDLPPCLPTQDEDLTSAHAFMARMMAGVMTPEPLCMPTPLPDSPIPSPVIRHAPLIPFSIPTPDVLTECLDQPSRASTPPAQLPQCFNRNEDVQIHTPVVEDIAEGIAGGISTPSDVPTSSSSSKSIPKLGPISDSDMQELWPEFTSMFKHLLQPSPPPTTVVVPTPSDLMPGAMFSEEPEAASALNTSSEAPTTVDESPLVGEPLLCRPLMPETEKPLVDRCLSDFFNSLLRDTNNPPPLPAQNDEAELSPIVVVPPFESPKMPSPTTPFWQSVMARPNQPLLAEFVSDNNIADGQIFPPGAEFVKSWRMRNDGERDWPETTELVFVAGDRLAPYAGAPTKVKVGVVKSGAEVELVSGEMKVRRC